MVLIDSRVFVDFVSFSRGSSSTGWTSSDKLWRWISWRATNATANAVAGDRTSTLDAAIERELRLVLAGGVKQVPRLLPARSSRDGSHINMLVPGVPTSVVAGFVLWNKKGQHFWTARPCHKVWQKRTGWAVQNCCPFFGDPKVTF